MSILKRKSSLSFPSNHLCLCSIYQVQREPSGATGARSSSSVSRDRASLARRAAADEGSGEGRNASMSPTRAMGARSVSIERKAGSGSGQPIYRGLNTLEGIGSSVSPQVNPAAIDDRRGRTGFRVEDNLGAGEVGRGRNPVGSPTGARSVSANRQPRIAEE